MQYLRDTGFVLKRVNLGEADRFVTLFTRNNGKVEVLAKGVRKVSSRRASSVELLNLIDLQAVKTKKHFILTEVAVKSPFEKIRKTFDGCQVIFLVSELLDGLCAENQANEAIFNSLYHFLNEASFTEEDMLQFETDLLVNLGYWDSHKTFINAKAAQSFIENILERKIRTQAIVY